MDVKGTSTVSKDLKVIGNTDIVGQTSIHGVTELGSKLRVHDKSYMTGIDTSDYITFTNSDTHKTGLYWNTGNNTVALTRKGLQGYSLGGGTVLTLSSSPSNQDDQGNLILREINYEMYDTHK